MFFAKFGIVKVTPRRYGYCRVDVSVADENVLGLKSRHGNRLVDESFQRNYFSTAKTGVRRNQQPGFGVIYSRSDTGRSEAGEDNGVNEAQPDAGQHRKGSLRYHRKINDYTIALPQSKLHRKARDR
jgi:hypothetical protein